MALLLAFLCALLFPSGLPAAPARVEIQGPWRYAFSDNPDYRLPGFDDAAWKTTQLPAAFDAAASGGSTVLWLRAPLPAEPAEAGERLYLLAGRITGSVEFYLNGVVIGVHGSFPPHYQYVVGLMKSALVPPDLLRPGGRNLLAVRVFNEAALFTVPAAALDGEGAWAKEAGLNFLNLGIYMIFSMLCFFIFLFFMLQFALRTDERPALLFGLANLGFAVYFFNMGLERQFLPFVGFNAAAKSLLVLVIADLALFFIEFFRIHNRRWVKILILAPAVCLAIPFWIFPRSTADVSRFFSISLISVELDILFMLYVAIRAAAARSRDALPILMGTIVGICLGSYDVVHQMSGRDPAFWLQGIGIFAFNLSMFAALSLQQIRMRREIEVYSRQLSGRTRELEHYMRAAGDVSSSVSTVARELEEGIASASSSVDGLALRSGEISDSMTGQFAVVKETQTTIMGLLASFEEVYAALESQARAVDSTRSAVEGLLAGVQGISESLKETTELTGLLGEKTHAAESAVDASTQAIGKVREASASIHEIVDAVAELADRTNLLAMNAAIEAAHAGSLGRGFGVVAGEIKTLSEASSRRSQEILGHITAIRARIDEGVRVNGKVSQALTDIASSTGAAIDRVQAVYEAVAGQRAASERITGSLSFLTAATARIRDQADAQKSGSAEIRTRLEGLVSSSQSVVASVAAIGEENARIVDLVGRIRGISGTSRSIISRMQALLDRQAGPEAGVQE